MQREEVAGESEIRGMILGAERVLVELEMCIYPHLSYALHDLFSGPSAWATSGRVGSQSY